MKGALWNEPVKLERSPTKTTLRRTEPYKWLQRTTKKNGSDRRRPNHRGPFPLRELHSTDDTIVWRDPGGSWACLRPVSDYEWIHPFRGCRWHRHTCMWRLCEAGRFSYGESPRTPPLEETSLHRWNNSVERPWGILSLFTTCLQVQSPCHSLWHMWNTPQTAH